MGYRVGVQKRCYLSLSFTSSGGKRGEEQKKCGLCVQTGSKEKFASRIAWHSWSSIHGQFLQAESSRTSSLCSVLIPLTIDKKFGWGGNVTLSPQLNTRPPRQNGSPTRPCQGSHLILPPLSHSGSCGYMPIFVKMPLKGTYQKMQTPLMSPQKYVRLLAFL